MATPKKDIDAWAATLARGESVPFTFSRGKTVGLIIASLIFVLIGLVMAGSDSILWKIIGWVAVVLFLISTIFMIRRLFIRVPALTVSPEGVAMKTAKAGVIPWSEILDIRPVKQNSNVFIEMVITTAEADRQAAAGLGVAKRTLDDGSLQTVLWAPNGLAARKPELCYWLDQEREARATV
ncbi:MAG: STM3941 family protein [Brevibacterium aurantiacum]|uniref:STM3941 family protein n=1 Tax=Brevibacterium aurantiacum TaxID=273384 RepID=UPI003F9286E0